MPYKDPSKEAARVKAYRGRNPEAVKAAARKAQRKRSGAINATSDTKSGPCEICKTETKTLQWDHDHFTLEFRGWLCRPCNVGLGHFKDNPERMESAVQYLRRKL